MAWNPRRSKNNPYGATQITTDGYSFASKLESAVYTVLKSRQNAGELEIVQVQDHVYLTRARIHYIPDFKCKCLKTGEFFWVEAKGYANDVWPTKKKLWKFYGPGKLEIWKGDFRRPFLDEEIIPQLGLTDL